MPIDLMLEEVQKLVDAIRAWKKITPKIAADIGSRPTGGDDYECFFGLTVNGQLVGELHETYIESVEIAEPLLVSIVSSHNATLLVEKMLRSLAETWLCEDPAFLDDENPLEETPCGTCPNCRKLAIVEGMK